MNPTADADKGVAEKDALDEVEIGPMPSESSTSAEGSTATEGANSEETPNSQSGEGSFDPRRVKVYSLNESGGWDDHGTGFIHFMGPDGDNNSENMSIPGIEQSTNALRDSKNEETMQTSSSTQDAGKENSVPSKEAQPATGTDDDNSAANLADEIWYEVRHEDGKGIILKQKLCRSTNYEKQETIMTWHDNSTGTDMALSFQDPKGAEIMWAKICQMYGKDPNSVAVGNAQPGDDGKLPEPTCANLEKIRAIVQGGMSGEMIREVIETKYFCALAKTFSDLEDLEDNEGLAHLFSIYRMLMMMGSPDLHPQLLGDDEIFGMVVGILEYDPEMPKGIQHRRFFQRPDLFKEPIKVEDGELRGLVHLTFRLIYMKEVVMARIIDDFSFSVLQDSIGRNIESIVAQVEQSQTFVKSLMFGLIDSEASEIQRAQVFRLLHELSEFSNKVAATNRMNLIKKLVANGLFTVLASSVADKSLPIAICSLEVLNNLALVHMSKEVQDHILQNRGDSSSSLLNSLMDGLLENPEQGIKIQCVEAIRVLTAALPSEAHEDAFIQHFYSEAMPRIAAQFDSFDAEKEKTLGASERHQRATMFSLLIDLVCGFIPQHGFAIKNFILQKDLSGKLLKLLDHKHKFLVLAAVRFLRACIGAKDTFYDRHIIKTDALGKIINLYEKIQHKNNMLNSAILDLFHFMREAKTKILIEHVMDKHGEQFRRLQGSMISDFVNRFDQTDDGDSSALSSQSINPAPSTGYRRVAGHRDGRDLEDEDDSYFAKDEPEDNDAGLAALSSYDDEEEDGRPGPPPIKKAKVEETMFE